MKKTVAVAIKGISPLLMHAFPMEPVEAIEKKTPQEQAELSLYKHPETRSPYIPAITLQRALIGGAAYSKGKGRGSLQKQAAACLLVEPEYISLNGAHWRIDSRPVVVPATRGRILRHRPRFDTWEVAFEVSYDDTLLSEKQLREIFDSTGSRVGLLDFRPERKGPFGRFMVTTWKEA